LPLETGPDPALSRPVASAGAIVRSMIRDMDLVRELLLQIERAGPAGIDGWVVVDGYDQPTIAYHTKLLKTAGLIDAYILEADGVPPVAARINCLTWAGHDFLDAIKNDTVWNRTKRTIAEKGGGATVEIVKALAVTYAKAHFGIPG